MARTARPSLADAIAAHVTVKGPRCGVALIRDQLDPDHSVDFDTALANRLIPAPAISKGLDAIGHKLPPLTIQRHRRGECTCPR